ncbi:MAG: hypothetical protein H6Q59_1263, partial [Firmicutes bacterium]|nr:hypothetical protein [Bacillota bacterium]
NREELTICINGIWKLTKYHTLTGDITPYHCKYLDGKTYLKEEVYDHDSLLYYMERAEEEETILAKEVIGNDILVDDTDPKVQEVRYPDKLRVTLSEPNVLLLDMAEYHFDEGQWFPKEELLRIDNQYRELLGYPLRTEAYAQPWLSTDNGQSNHTLSLRFKIQSECEIHAPLLALEDAEDIAVRLNGTAVPSNVTGWYTDRDIQTIALPDLICGTNILEITIPYHSKRNVEYLYLLGDFSVSVAGRNTVLGLPVTELAFGDICNQGLPFYGGNITYELPVLTESGRLKLQAAQFRCPVIKTTLDGREKGCIAFSPYTLDLGDVNKGSHTIGITAYGNRVNTFGPIHNCNHTEHWIGPNAWRTTGTAWSYEYQLKKSGILVSPNITLEA